METQLTPNSNILERYQQLVEISRDLANTLDLESLLHRIIQAAVDFTGAEAASILLWDPKKRELTFQAVSNVEIEAKLCGLVVPAESIGGWVALNRQPVIVGDAHQDTRFFNNVETESSFPTRSVIAVPLIYSDKLIGVLEVLNKKEDIFNHEDLEVLRALGAQAAIAIENNRLFEQTDLVAGLVHELRTPLSSLTLIAYLLQKPDLNQDQRISLSKTISNEIERLNKLASDFLNLSRMEVGKVHFEKQPLDIRTLLQECILVMNPRALEMQLTLEVDLSAELPVIQGDGDRLKQLFFNLLSNAIKYNRPDGKVIIKTLLVGREIKITIADTGHGLTAEELSHLFEKYFRARSTENIASGTGLGLTISKKIVEGHKGRITVQSQPDVGTTFEVFLPIK